MSITKRFRYGVSLFALILALVGLGCEGDSLPRSPTPHKELAGSPVARAEPAAKPAEPKPADPPPAEPKSADAPKQGAAKAQRVPVGKNVYFERIADGDRRRVIVNAYVCLREGNLEQLMCRQHTKEHEAILAADCDARDIHKALLATRAKPGSTVRYDEKDGKPVIIPPTGQPIRVTLQYQDKGKLVTVPAQKWVRNNRTKKELEYNWVFAGSHFVQDPDDANRPPLYAANSGDVITVSNFEGAMLDLPVASSKDNDELQYEACTERIPPLETKVTIILEPLPEPKKR